MEAIEIKIIRMPNGNCALTGPIQDKALCYGMLECARDAIQAWHADPANRQRIAIPTLVPRIETRNGGGSGH